MKSTSEVTACVIDCGLFIPFARRLAEDFNRVLFYNPERRSFPSLKQGCIGAGFDDIESTLDFWPHLDEIDLFCFPDIGHAGLQAHLKSIGKSVWGSGGHDRLEINREFFLKKLGELGLQVPQFSVCVGMVQLRDYLKQHEDQYVKVSRWRGDLETTHWRSWAMDRGWLDWLGYSLGPMQDHVRFLVFPAIDTPLEIGGDTYCVKGQWPGTMLNGLEHKDTTYFSSVSRRSEMPGQIQEILEAFGPELSGYANQWSMEVRVKGDHAYFIDATCRGGMPSSASQQMLWNNFGEIVWAGANGELVEPDPVAKFSIECMVSSKTCKDSWDLVELPERIDRSVRFSNCCRMDGCYAFPPDEFFSGDLGWLCVVADTQRGALDMAKWVADQLPDGLDANLENLTGLIKEIEAGEQAGIPMTLGDMPKPAEVIAE